MFENHLSSFNPQNDVVKRLSKRAIVEGANEQDGDQIVSIIPGGPVLTFMPPTRFFPCSITATRFTIDDQILCIDHIQSVSPQIYVLVLWVLLFAFNVLHRSSARTGRHCIVLEIRLMDDNDEKRTSNQISWRWLYTIGKITPE